MKPKLEKHHVLFEQFGSRVRATVRFEHKLLRAHDCNKIGSEVARTSAVVQWAAIGSDNSEAYAKLKRAVPYGCVVDFLLPAGEV